MSQPHLHGGFPHGGFPHGNVAVNFSVGGIHKWNRTVCRNEIQN